MPYENPRLPVHKQVADLLARMNLDEKVGQMTQTERYQAYDDESPITTWKLGSILSGGGSPPEENTPEAWADMVDRFQSAALATRLRIPLIYGIDAVHGNNNLYGATVFAHNIGLGATRNPALVRKIAHLTAIETRASGPQWTFAPAITAPQDDRWGRTYEGFSENPKLVIKMETAIDGYQGSPGQLADRDRVLATAKHYAGDGDTDYGTFNTAGNYPIDPGISITNRRDFWRNSLRQYPPAIRRHNAGTVMPVLVDHTGTGVRASPGDGGVGMPVEAMAGALGAVDRVRAAGMPVGVVGFGSPPQWGPAADGQAVRSAVETVLGPFDTRRCAMPLTGKRSRRHPLAPGLLLAAAHDLGGAPHEVAVISDTSPDLRAAQASAAGGILVPSPQHKRRYVVGPVKFGPWGRGNRRSDGRDGPWAL